MRRPAVLLLSATLLALAARLPRGARRRRATPTDIVLPDDGRRVEGTVGPGETFAGLLERHQVAAGRSPGLPRRRRAGVQLAPAPGPPRLRADARPRRPRPRADLSHRPRSLPAGAARLRAGRGRRVGAASHGVARFTTEIVTYRREVGAGRDPRRHRSRAPVARRGPRSRRRGRRPGRRRSPSCSAATSISTATCSRATRSRWCSSRCCATASRIGYGDIVAARLTNAGRAALARSASSRPAASRPTTTPPGCR